MGSDPGERTGVAAPSLAALRGAALYESALASGGGRRIEWVSQVKDQELAVGLYEAEPYDINVEEIATPRLSINLMKGAVCGRIGDDRVRSYSGRRHSLFFTPSTADARWAKAQPSRHLNIYFSQAVFDHLDDRHGAVIRPAMPLLDALVPRIKPLIDALEFSIRQPSAFAREAALGLSHLIIAELATATQRRPRRSLAPRSVDVIKDYVSAHLGTKMRIAELAALAGLSSTQFSLRFNASEGCSPHQYILRRRIQECVRRLRHTRSPLEAIAADCGFSSHQHMTTVIKNKTGFTPTQIRAGS